MFTPVASHLEGAKPQPCAKFKEIKEQDKEDFCRFCGWNEGEHGNQGGESNKSIGDVNEKAGLGRDLLFQLIQRICPEVESLNLSPSREYSFQGSDFKWTPAAKHLRAKYGVKEVDDGHEINEDSARKEFPCLEIDALAKGFLVGGVEIDVSPPSTPLDLLQKIKANRTIPLLSLVTPGEEKKVQIQQAVMNVKKEAPVKLNVIFLFETTLDVMPTTIQGALNVDKFSYILFQKCLKVERALMLLQERYGNVEVVQGIFLDSPSFYLYDTTKNYSPFQSLFNSIFSQNIPGSSFLFKDALPLLSLFYTTGRFFPIPRKIRVGSLAESRKLQAY